MSTRTLASALLVIGLITTDSNRPCRANDCIDYARATRFRDLVLIDSGPLAGEGDLLLALDKGANPAELHVVDVAVPGSAALLNTIALDSAKDVALDGTIAFAVYADSTSASRLRVLDLATPATPVVLADIAISGSDVRGISIDGPRAYIVDFALGIEFIDIADPSNPSPVWNVFLPSATGRLLVRGELAYLLAGGLIHVIYLPHGSAILGTVAPDSGSFLDFDVAGDHAYATVTGNRMEVFDVSTATNPFFLASTEVQGILGGVAVVGNEAMVTAGIGGVRLVDISDPSSPIFSGGIHLEDIVSGVELVSGRLWTSGQSLQEFEPGSESLPAPVLIEDFEILVDAAFANDLAFVSDRGDSLKGLRIFDLTEAPLLVSSIPSTHDPGKLAFADGILAWGDRTAGGGVIRLLDLSDPASPVELGAVPHPGGFAARKLGFGDGVLVVELNGDFFFELWAIDISDPTSPVLGAKLPVVARDWVCIDRHVYNVGSEIIEIVSVEDPFAPSLVEFSGLPGSEQMVAGEPGSLALFIDGGFSMYELSNPGSPMSVGGFSPLDWPAGMWTEGIVMQEGTIWAWRANTQSSGGFHLVDASDPSDVQYVGGVGVNVVGAGAGLLGVNGCPFARDGQGTLRVFPAQCPVTVTSAESVHPAAAVAFGAARPNPFDADTRFELHLDRPSAVDVSVYDVLGRRVRSIARSFLSAGAHGLAWDGRDDSGSKVAGGVYFIRFERENEVDARKVTMLRR